MNPPTLPLAAAPGPAAATTVGSLDWRASCLWLALAAGAFHGAYSSLQFPAAGWLMFGFALALVRLTHQPTVRRAFYFGLSAGLLCYAPQLWFFWKIFSAAALVLWVVLAFWVGLFAALACGSRQRWGPGKAIWLIPVLWTGLEYFRSELYYLKFSWLNAGAPLPVGFHHGLGLYGVGFSLFLLAANLGSWRRRTLPALLVVGMITLACAALSRLPLRPAPSPTAISLVGVQLEFPPENLVPRILDQALAKHTNAQIFVLSEYALDGPVPEALKAWCHQHAHYLVVGGKDPAAGGHFYDTAFVVGPNGDVVFQQGKCVPIQFFQDGLPAPNQSLWDSPWGRIGFCVCYDLSYSRVTDALVRQGAQLMIVPTMDVESWSRHEHELHFRVAPVRAAEYGVPIFRLASSGISQAVAADGRVVAQAPMPGNGAVLAATLALSARGSLPLDRYLAPLCSGLSGFLFLVLIWPTRRNGQRGALAHPAGDNAGMEHGR